MWTVVDDILSFTFGSQQLVVFKCLSLLLRVCVWGVLTDCCQLLGEKHGVKLTVTLTDLTEAESSVDRKKCTKNVGASRSAQEN